jgi:hypothetical protein
MVHFQFYFIFALFSAAVTDLFRGIEFQQQRCMCAIVSNQIHNFSTLNFHLKMCVEATAEQRGNLEQGTDSCSNRFLTLKVGTSLTYYSNLLIVSVNKFASEIKIIGLIICFTFDTINIPDWI